MRLINQGKSQLTGREEDQLIASFHHLASTQQAALIALVDRIVEGTSPLP